MRKQKNREKQGYREIIPDRVIFQLKLKNSSRSGLAKERRSQTGQDKLKSKCKSKAKTSLKMNSHPDWTGCMHCQVR